MASIDNTTTNCASCGKEGGNLNTCNKCNMVKYCNAACKKKHRSKHKKACEKRVAELHDEALFREHPPREECPICYLPLPFDPTFQTCCGKVICCGCIHAMAEEAHGRGKIELCAFCRVPTPTSYEEIVKQLQKLMEANNAHAFYILAGYYRRGNMGMPRNIEKANELLVRAGELGCAEAHYNLGVLYEDGRDVEEKKKAKYCYELAVMYGDVKARHNLGCMEEQTGNHHRAMQHFIIAAKAGHKKSLDNVKKGFMNGMITKDEYADSLRAYQQRHDETKSDARDKAHSALLYQWMATTW